VIVQTILSAVYITVMLSHNGQTVGNMAVQTRTVDVGTGQPPTAQKAFIRWACDGVFAVAVAVARVAGLPGLVFLFSLPLLVDYLWPLWDSQNQTLHDKIAGTYVLRLFN
jgi:uncharacterized RDD family membrane protein YckC